MTKRPSPKHPTRRSLAAAFAHVVAVELDNQYLLNTGGEIVRPITGGMAREDVVVAATEEDFPVTLGELLDATIEENGTLLVLPDGRLLKLCVEHRACFEAA